MYTWEHGEVFKLKEQRIGLVKALQEKSPSGFQNATESISGAITATFFPSSKAWGFKHKGIFISSNSNHADELELTIPIVAFGATAVYTAISKWREGKPLKTEHFIGDVYEGIYAHHVSYLEELQATIPKNFHFIMHSLYKTAMASGRSQLVTNGKNEPGPLTGVDMEGLD
ncbi:hypothetical protein BJ165DRAFT_1409931 [Panaeolus papilionaceus]|nr:hypothetical protein BJ165DRAFT_1409931 [Panaeolus papilionaceus]